MTKGIFSKWAASSVMLMVAFVMSVMVSGTAVAQDVVADSANWGFEPLEFEFSSGDSTGSSFYDLPAVSGIHNVRYVSAILSASDENKNIYGSANNWRDGSINPTGGNARLIFNSAAPGNDQGAIIANIESSDINDTSKPNEPLNMVAVLNNVDAAIVTALKNEAAGGTTAQAIINRITAEFSYKMFGAANTGAYANVRPTSVTGVVGGDITGNSLGFPNVSFATSIVVRWDSVSNTALKASATDRTVAAAGGFNATITINGAKPGPSNLVGLEVDGFTDATTLGAHARKSGPDIAYDGTVPDIKLEAVYDTVSEGLHFNTVVPKEFRELNTADTHRPGLAMFNPFGVNSSSGILIGSSTVAGSKGNGIIRLTTATPTGTLESGKALQLRASDVVVVRAKINVNSSMDGEPDAYFGGANTDPIALGDLSSNTTLSNSLLNRYNNLNSSGQISNSSSRITITITSKTDSENVFVKDFTSISVIAGEGNQAVASGDSAVIDVTFPITSTLATSGEFEEVTFNLAVNDDIGYATNANNPTNTNRSRLFVDTLGPVVTNVNLSAEVNENVALGDVGYLASRKISGSTTSVDEMIVKLGLETNGEIGTDFAKWANITIQPSTGGWVTSASPISFLRAASDGGLGNTGGFVRGSSERELVPAVSGGNVLGVSAFMRINHRGNYTSSDTNVYVIASVSDDARNPAIAWVPLQGDPKAHKQEIRFASSIYGNRLFTGVSNRRYPHALIDSSTLNISALNNTSQSVFLQVKSSTVAVDNNPPDILSATLSVLYAPENFWNDLTNTSSDGLARFRQILNTTDTLANGINSQALIDFGTTTAKAKGAEILFSNRSTASIINNPTQNQKGSPLRLVVQFDVAGAGAQKVNDLGAIDHFTGNGATSLTDAAMKTFVQNNYTFEIVSNQIGFASHETGFTTSKAGNELDADWSLQSATITGSGIGYATLENTVGINHLESVDGSSIIVNNKSISNASVVVRIADKVRNFPNMDYSAGSVGFTKTIGLATRSNAIIVDVSAPIVQPSGMFTGDSSANNSELYGTLINGYGKAATRIVLVTNVNGRSFAEVVSDLASKGNSINEYLGLDGNNVQFAHYSSFSGTVGDASTAKWGGFINSVTVGLGGGLGGNFNNNAAAVDSNSSATFAFPRPSIQSGYMLIISATFQENNLGAANNAFHRFNNVPHDMNTFTGAFPYILSASGVRSELAPVVDAIDSASFAYGNSWKTVSADFSDFITAAKAVLPTVSANISSGTVTGSFNSGDVLAATWFYTISSSGVNTSLSSSAVRSVTLFARDLSGNVTYDVIPVGVADFAVPVVTIESLKMTIPKRGLSNLVLEGSGSGTAAQAISAATYNKNDATMQLVVKVTGSTLATTTLPIFANLSNLGGGSAVAQSATTTVPSGLSISQVTSGSIIYATWEIGKFDTTLVNRTGKITVSAIGSSLAKTDKETTKIDVDQVVPDFTPVDANNSRVHSILEETISGSSTNSSFDTKGDGVIRPGQVVTVFTRIDNIDAVGTESDLSGNNNILTANLSEFDLGTAVLPTQTQNTANKAYSATWQFTVPSSLGTKSAKITISATDPAGNTNTQISDTVFVQSARPIVTENILSASKNVGYASNTLLTRQSFFEIGTKNNSNVAVFTHAPTERTIVIKNGDQIKIESDITIADPAFTDISVYADLSQILQSAPTKQNFGVSDTAVVTNNGVTTVFPTTKNTGNNVNAEWIIALSNMVESATNASIIINATVGETDAFKSTGNAIMTVPVEIDNVAPEVKIDVTWYKDGKVITEDSLFAASPNGATAAVIVYATLTDASNVRGYIGAPYAGAISNSLTPAATASLITMDGSKFGAASVLRPEFWTLSNTTGALANTSTHYLVTSSSSSVDIANTTATVLTAYFGLIPTSAKKYFADQVTPVPEITVTSVNQLSANFVARVSDAVGNQGSATSNTVEADGTDPTIEPAPVDKAVYNLSTGNNKFIIDVVPGTKHWPAYYSASGQLVAVTRVGNNSQITGRFKLQDSPNDDETILATVKTDQFGGKDIIVEATNAAEITNIVAGKSTQRTFNANPSTSNSTVVNITFTATTGGTNSQTLDANDNDSNASDGILDFGYSGAMLSLTNPNDGFSTGARVIVEATDTEGNETEDVSASTALDYDKQTPLFTTAGSNDEIAVFQVDSSDIANSISRTSSQTKAVAKTSRLVNAETGKWLVLSASIVVDGTDSAHLPTFNVNWSEALEQDIGRLVAGTQASGNSVIINGVTPSARAVRFATSIVQIRSNASPSNAQNIKVTLSDFFGNTRSLGTGVDDYDARVAISSSGPSASQLLLFVNGISQTSGTSLLGIGNGGPDSASASFELAPGDVVELEAILNTVGTGRAPQFITANFSSLYPPELLNSVDAIIPSVTSVQADGTVLARWTHIAADYSNITNLNGKALTQIPDSYTLNDTQLTPRTESNVLQNGIIASATINTATRLLLGEVINSQGITQTILDNIQGLPKIQVQANARATMSASVTVRVNEEAPLNLFGQTFTKSTEFAVDTQTPLASWYVPYEHITRALPVPLSGLTGFDKDTGLLDPAKGRARIGFPTTPVLTANDRLNNTGVLATEIADLASIYSVPARVRGGDSVYIIANVTNANISGNGDDRFRPYPGTTFDAATVFNINSANLDVVADLSEFGGSDFREVSILGSTTGSDANPAFNVLTKNQNFAGKATQIAATYALTISSSLGTEVASSRRLRDATFVVIDDAGNKPFDTFQTVGLAGTQTDNQIKQLIRPGGIGIDNTPTTISGTLDVLLVGSGGTTTTVQTGAAIQGGSELRIQANINESVDHPLDVLNNPNFGSVALTAQGIELPAANVVLQASSASLSGNSITVPFKVDIPEVEDGISTRQFRFIISATDSVGNTSSRLSNDTFKFDARPAVVWADALGTSVGSTVTFHAGGPALALSANSFDVGGVSEAIITFDPDVETLAANGITVTSALVGTGGTGVEDVNVPVTITSVAEVGNIPFIIATLDTVDVSSATNQVKITIDINRPALFAADFGLTAVNSAGADIAPATVLSGSSSLESEGDVREITISEGSTLTLALATSDGDGDAVIVSATGTAFGSTFEDSVYDATTGTFTFKPGFKAVTGDEISNTFDAVFSANDGSHPTSDVVTIRVTVTAEAAVPEVNIASIQVTDLRSNEVTFTSATKNDTVLINENRSIEMVVVSTDAGGEELSFNTSVNTPLVFTSETSNAPGIVTATIAFTLGYNDADILISESAIDPSLFTFESANSANVGSATKRIDVVNTSQPGTITTSYTRNGGSSQSLENGGTVTALAGDVIVITVHASDPDQIDRFSFPVINSLAGSVFTIQDAITGVGPNGTTVTNTITVTVATSIPEDSTAVINYSVTKDTLDAIQSSATYNVFATSTPPEPVVQVDELILSQGLGGQNLVNVRNFDSSSAAPLNSIIDRFRSIGPVALEAWGGGTGRGTNVSTGDVDNDGDLDYVLSFGAVSSDAAFPNMVIVRDVATKSLTGHAFQAFPNNASTIGYANGELRTAVGDFLTNGQNLVAVAQGLGSTNSLIRVFRATGNAAPNGWEVVAQFQPLDTAPNTANANGGVTLDAADVDGDGLDELIVAQTPSATSQTQYTVIDVAADGTHRRTNFAAIPADFRGNTLGGVDVAAADLNGDGIDELVFANSQNSETGAFGGLLSIVTPTVAGGAVTGYTRPGSSIINIVDLSINPGGGLNISSGELDGNESNGDEILIGSGSGAPQSFYRVVKLGYDGTNVTGFTYLIGPPGNIGFVQAAFVGEFNPTSGAVNVDAANHTALN